MIPDQGKGLSETVLPDTHEVWWEREQFTKELKKYDTKLLSNNLKVKHSLASVFMRGLIHSDDQSY